VAPAGIDLFISGNDVITLTTPREKWYICCVDDHCKAGDQKLAIILLPLLPLLPLQEEEKVLHPYIITG
jgi:hypothetical protein